MTAPNPPSVTGPSATSWSPHAEHRELPPLRLTDRGAFVIFLAVVALLALALIGGQAKTSPIREQCEQIAAPAYVDRCADELTSSTDRSTLP